MKLAKEVKKILKEEGFAPISPALAHKIYDIIKKDFPNDEVVNTMIASQFYLYLAKRLK